MDHLPRVEVCVWGDFACFTRPETKVERVSYSLMTPSAARGIVESIFWKPEMRWRITEIWVLRPIRYFSIVRNEIKSRQSFRLAQQWASGGVGDTTTAPGYDVEEDRTQRHTLALRDVAYLIRAQVELRPHADADAAKYREMFRRRVAAGQCFSMPYLGCREFSAAFAPPDGSERPIALTDGIGPMLLDLEEQADGTFRPHFFDAELRAGVLHVPPRPTGG